MFIKPRKRRPAARAAAHPVPDAAPGNPDDMIPRHVVQRMLGNPSRMTLHRWQQTADFPRAIKLGQGATARNFWRRGDVAAWITARAAAAAPQPEHTSA
jgi:predicted DNA-binding transcriptional regulator AlpA